MAEIPSEQISSPATQPTVASGPWRLLVILLGLELLVALVFLWISVVGLLHAVNEPAQDLFALLAMAVLAVFWVLAACVGSLYQRSWARALSFTVQIGIFAVALSGLQGLWGSPGQALVLLATGLIGGYLCVRVRPQQAAEPEQ